MTQSPEPFLTQDKASNFKIFYELVFDSMKKSFKVTFPYLIIGLFSFFILFWVLELWNAHLKVPFVYSEDGLFYLGLIKGVIDNGWFLYNKFVGMPLCLEMHDFPITDNFHFLFMKLISFFFQNHAAVLNLYYLLTFPLTAVTSLFVFRFFKLSYGPSFLGSLLFAFLPYHFQRGEHHILLSTYYLIPLMVMVILLLFTEGTLFFKDDQENHKLRVNLRHFNSLFSIGVCILVGSAGVYYAFFSCFFLLVAGISSSMIKKRFYPFLISGILIVVISISVLVNITPSILYSCRNGKNLEVTQRSAVDAEIYGMKIAQLLLPVTGHRLPFLNKLKNDYNYAPYRPLINENGSSTLGFLGSIGFFILIGWLFYKNPRASNSELKISLSILNVSAIFLGTIGGFGSLFAFLLSPQIRSYNRISVYIAFFSLFALALLLQEYYQKHVKLIKGKVLFYLFLIVFLTIGILDQTTKDFIPQYSSVQLEYSNDFDFINRIENAVPKNAMIFQLPYVSFPESWPVHKMTDYALFKGYLHSKTLRWSYGAMSGREGDPWQRWVTSKPLNDFLETIALAGFVGIYLDRFGYPDRGAEIDGKLSTLLDKQPIISDNNRLIFYDMSDFFKRTKEKYSNIEKSSIPGLKKLEKVSLPTETKNISYHIDLIKQYKNYIEITGWAFINDKGSEKSKIYLGLRLEGNSYRLHTTLMKRPDVTVYFKSLNFDDSGFSAILAKEEIEIGSYKVGIGIQKDNIEAFQYTDKVVKIERH